MSSSPWRVRLNQDLIKFIRGTPEPLKDEYMRAVEGVIEVAETYSKLGIASCGEGFLIPVKDQGEALRCVVKGHDKEIHISGIKKLTS